MVLRPTAVFPTLEEFIQSQQQSPPSIEYSTNINIRGHIFIVETRSSRGNAASDQRGIYAENQKGELAKFTTAVKNEFSREVGEIADQLRAFVFSPENLPLPSKSVRFNLFDDPTPGATSGALQKPVSDRAQIRMNDTIEQVLAMLAPVESDQYSALQLLRDQFHRSPDTYGDFAILLQERSTPEVAITLSKLITQAELEETVAMESTIAATMVDLIDVDKTVATLEKRLKDATTETGEPLPGKEKIARRYKMTIEDLLVAKDAATQREGSTQKLWTGGPAPLPQEEQSILTQFRELLTDGTFDQQMSFINSIRSPAVLQRMQTTLELGMHDDRLVLAATHRQEHLLAPQPPESESSRYDPAYLQTRPDS